MNLDRLIKAWTSAQTPRDLSRALVELARDTPPEQMTAPLKAMDAVYPRSDLDAVVAAIEAEVEDPPDLRWLREELAARRDTLALVVDRQRELAAWRARRVSLQRELDRLKGAGA